MYPGATQRPAAAGSRAGQAPPGTAEAGHRQSAWATGPQLPGHSSQTHSSQAYSCQTTDPSSQLPGPQLLGPSSQTQTSQAHRGLLPAGCSQGPGVVRVGQAAWSWGSLPSQAWNCPLSPGAWYPAWGKAAQPLSRPSGKFLLRDKDESPCSAQDSGNQAETCSNSGPELASGQHCPSQGCSKTLKMNFIF